MATKDHISPDEMLDTVKRVEAPPYMFTRIQAKLEAAQQAVVKPVFAWSLAGLILILVLVNFLAIKKYNQSSHQENLVETFNLAPDNDFYSISYEND